MATLGREPLALGLEFARQYAADRWRVIATCPDPAAAGDLGALPGDVRVEALPRYPSVTRDLSLLVDATLPVAALRGTALGVGSTTLQHVREFDRYQGKGVPEGQVSVSLRLTFRSPDRTLTDAARLLAGMLPQDASAYAAVTDQPSWRQYHEMMEANWAKARETRYAAHLPFIGQRQLWPIRVVLELRHGVTLRRQGVGPDQSNHARQS